MTLSAPDKKTIITDYRRSETDSGSPEVQIALLTQRINDLTNHMKSHRKDYASRRGLMVMVSKRNRLLQYLSRSDMPRYQGVINRLGLRK